MCTQMSEECVDINRSFALLAGVRWGPTPKHLFVDSAYPTLIVQTYCQCERRGVTGRKKKRKVMQDKGKWTVKGNTVMTEWIYDGQDDLRYFCICTGRSCIYL